MNEPRPTTLDPQITANSAPQPLATAMAAGVDMMPELSAQAGLAPIDEQDIVRLMAELDLTDSNSVLFYGAKAQERLTEVSDQMLEGVRSQDLGSAGSALTSMIAAIKGFDVERLNPQRRRGVIARLMGKRRSIAKFLREYDAVRDQIEEISGDLERHKTRLLTDVTSLDRLYDANLEYFQALEGYILAGQRKLAELDQETLPTLAAQVEAGSELIEAQQLRDLRGARDDLERRVHDLQLTRQVSLQALPGIRLVQENDKGLINKINSTLVNTVPLWRQQLAQAVTIFRSSQAAKSIRAATDLTNELLQANADNLRTANAEARRQVERGVFDIEVVKHANEQLIATIQESLAIADEGKRARAIASRELEKLEGDLRRTLSAASARERGRPGDDIR